MGREESQCGFRKGSPDRRLACWSLLAGTAAMLASCTATGPVATNSAVPPAANLSAPHDNRPAGEAKQLIAGADLPLHDTAMLPEMRPEGARPLGDASSAIPFGTILASYVTDEPAEVPGPKPLTRNALLPEISDLPGSSVKPTPSPAPLQPPAATPLISPPTLAVPASGARAEQSIADVLRYATQHHPTLRVHQCEIEAARARIITARLLPNPELTVDTLDSSTEPGRPTLGTRLMFTVPIGPKRELRTAAAESGVCQAQLAMSRDTKLILTEATDAAVEVLYLQELCALYRRLTELANQVVGIQKERFNVAAVPFRNVVLTELSASRLELLRQNATAQLDQAKVRLARAVGATDGTAPTVDGQLAVEPISFAPVTIMQARIRQVAPELAESRATIEKSREELSLEQWNAVPDLKIGPRYRSDLAGVSDDRWGARVQLDLPVFDRNQGRIAEGAANLRTNCAKRDLIEVAAVSDATSLYLELQDAQARAEYYSQQVRPLMEKTEKALREAFEDRTVTSYELTDLLESMARMQLNDLDLRHEHQRLRMRLELLLECRLSAVTVATPFAPASLPSPSPAALAPIPLPPPIAKPVLP